MKGAPSQQGGYSGGFGSQGPPPWLGMAQYFGGGYGGGYGAGQTGQQANPYSQPPMSVDFSHGAGLYQPNQAQPYYAGGQPPPPPPPPTQLPEQVGLGATGALAPGAGGAPLGLMGSAGTGSAGSGLLNTQPTWFNRGYGMPQGTVPQGGTGGNMIPPGIQQYLSGLFGGYR